MMNKSNIASNPCGVGGGQGVLIVRGGLSDQMWPFKIFENKTKYIYGNVSAWKKTT